MTERIWNIIAPYVRMGKETRKVDLKRELDISERPKQAELAKDICAIANTSGGSGYLIIGVQDAKERTSDDPSSYVVGVTCEEDDLQRQIQQALGNFCNPIPAVRYYTIGPPQIPRDIGVIVIPRSLVRPHEIARESGKVQRGIYVRRGAETFRAGREEIMEMTGAGRDTCILINLGRPLNKGQQEQICQLRNVFIAEVIQPDQTPPSFHDNEPYEIQTAQTIDGLGLTLEEWQSLPILVNLPGFAPAAAALVAELHGRMGHFPLLIRVRPSKQDRTVYEVAEIMDLQRIRDKAGPGGL